ncbi:hypothetical protein ACMFMG_006747 [Clarireedia jacksonii]
MRGRRKDRGYTGYRARDREWKERRERVRGNKRGRRISSGRDDEMENRGRRRERSGEYLECGSRDYREEYDVNSDSNRRCYGFVKGRIGGRRRRRRSVRERKRGLHIGSLKYYV